VFWGTAPSTLPEGAGKTLLVYHKDVPTKGGSVLMADCSTITQLNAEQYKNTPKPQGR
jgi:hypothetical protein